MEFNFYYNCMCHHCKKICATVKRCASCKTLSYCSREHQQLDWLNHRQLCKIIKKNVVVRPTPQKISWREHLKYRLTLKTLWERSLGRELYLFENQMWMFPKVCAVCYNATETLCLWCEKCMNVSYCSEEHRFEHSIKHEQFCAQLKLCMDIDVYLFINTDRIPILANSNVSINNKILKFPSNFDDLTSILNLEIINDRIQTALSSSLINPIATVLYCLDDIHFIVDRRIKRDNLTIHFIGAAILESDLNWNFAINLICGWIRNLKKLNIVLIGPELTDVNLPENTNSNDTEVSFNSHPEVYDKLRKSGTLQEPDVLVAFNSGLHEFEVNGDYYDTWSGALPFLLCEAPFIFTGYTMHEVVADLQRLNSIRDGLVLLKPQNNPFRSGRPFRDFETEDQPVFYENSWVCVVKQAPLIDGS